MPYDQIQGQGQGHRGLKCAELANFKVWVLRQYACIKRLAVNYDI